MELQAAVSEHLMVKVLEAIYEAGEDGFASLIVRGDDTLEGENVLVGSVVGNCINLELRDFVFNS